MQSDPNQQGYDNYGNTYANSYPPTNEPPPYSKYPQQTSGYQLSGTERHGQTQLYQQQGVVVVPVYRRWTNLVATSITSNLKIFFIISGLLSLVLGILDMGIEIGILLNSDTTYYRGLWAGGFLIGGGICMLIASCKVAYIMAYLIRLFAVTLLFVILGLVLSIINLATSIQCDSYSWYLCDDRLAINLKIVILVLFIISTIQTIVNIIVVSNAQKRTILTVTPNVPAFLFTPAVTRVQQQQQQPPPSQIVAVESIRRKRPRPHSPVASIIPDDDITRFNNGYQSD